jgi:hypothetical protein
MPRKRRDSSDLLLGAAKHDSQSGAKAASEVQALTRKLRKNSPTGSTTERLFGPKFCLIRLAYGDG